MKKYNEDITCQFVKICDKFANKIVIDEYEEDVKKIFSKIYAINYLKNKVETKKFFSTLFFKIVYSCLLESYALILNNYTRGASLVLRSSLENFIKHIIETINNLYNQNYNINDSIYVANKKTLSEVINNIIKDELKADANSINSRMESQYKTLSGLSHSLTEQSKNNIVDYFSNLNEINKSNMELVISEFDLVLDLIFELSIIICEPSLKKWDSFELEKILRIVFGKRKSNTYKLKLKA